MDKENAWGEMSWISGLSKVELYRFRKPRYVKKPFSASRCKKNRTGKKEK